MKPCATGSCLTDARLDWIEGAVKKGMPAPSRDEMAAFTDGFNAATGIASADFDAWWARRFPNALPEDQEADANARATKGWMREAWNAARATASETATPYLREAIQLAKEAKRLLDAYGESAPLRNSAIAMMNELLAHEATPSATATPIEETEDSEGDWQCKDYADGWLTFPTRKDAEKYQQQTGALMRYVRFYQHGEYVHGEVKS